MMQMFAGQKQNQQSQQSILSEGVDQLRANIKQIVGEPQKSVGPMRCGNFMGNEGLV